MMNVLLKKIFGSISLVTSFVSAVIVIIGISTKLFISSFRGEDTVYFGMDTFFGLDFTMRIKFNNGAVGI